ncbi:MAG TPA: 2-hydroxyglutaryl-CoA dehydratase [bacterium (Candidatus Stahlbacteria)]|nr:2-hydroxyglutaryl-CoA dehydratase [Candidatus Stahlbacteria bacterium]
MITLGVDIGSVTTKVVLLKGDKILALVIRETGAYPKLAAEKALGEALSKASLSKTDIEYIVSTGYGRRAIDFGDRVVTEISACAKGALYTMERILECNSDVVGIVAAKSQTLHSVRTIIDLGGQDTKVISLNENGDIADFVMNDKCAAGTGRFLEVIAQALQVGLEDLGELSLKSKSPIPINSTCTVFAESEVISLIAQGKSKEDIIAGINYSIAERIVGMLRQVGEKETIFFVGGGAKNVGIRKALEDKTGLKVYVPTNPQFVIALGAALIASKANES